MITEGGGGVGASDGAVAVVFPQPPQLTFFLHSRTQNFTSSYKTKIKISFVSVLYFIQYVVILNV